MNGKKRRIWRNVIRIAVLLLALLMGLPYLLPLSMPSAQQAAPPFDNSAFALIDGVQFHYRMYEPMTPYAKGKLLLVHGLAASTYSFEALAQLAQAEGYLTVAVDLPGFGYSGRPLHYDHSQANRARDLWQLLGILDQSLPEALSEAHWHLAGHSMGGGTVAAMAIAEPTRTARLILIDPSFYGDPRGALLAQFPPFRQWVQVAVEKLILTRANVRRRLASAYGQEPSDAQVQGYLAPLLLPGTARSLSSLLDAAMDETAPEKLASLGIPTLAVWGEKDTVIPVSQLDRLKAACPGIVGHVIPGAGHCPMETHVEELAALLFPWLETKP